MLFSGLDNPQKLPLTWTINLHLSAWFLGPTQDSPKWQLNQSSRFRRAYERDPQTAKLTDTHRLTMLLHLRQQPASDAMHVMRQLPPNNTQNITYGIQIKAPHMAISLH